jgi:hypothetical protein
MHMLKSRLSAPCRVVVYLDKKKNRGTRLLAICHVAYISLSDPIEKHNCHFRPDFESKSESFSSGEITYTPVCWVFFVKPGEKDAGVPASGWIICRVIIGMLTCATLSTSTRDPFVDSFVDGQMGTAQTRAHTHQNHGSSIRVFHSASAGRKG